MSTYAQLAQLPSSKKITIAELDIGQAQDFWVSWRAGCWMVNFDVLYPSDPEIDAALLGGVEAKEITRIGSNKSDGVSLFLVASAVDVQTNALSFYYDAGMRSLYVHLQDGNKPSLHSLFIGEAVGVSNFAGVHNEFLYEGRLRSAPAINKSKDPVFFGKIVFEGGEVVIDNSDGEFDRYAEDRDLFGNSARILSGFEGLDYAGFKTVFTGYIEDVSVGPEEFRVMIADKRKYLSKRIPETVFDQTTYPNLKDSNLGKSIPIGYGVMLGVPVICTNEDESPAPANYAFKLFDMSHHAAINEITTVYVNGVAKAPSATDLTLATFSLAAADYSPGDTVTCDCKGYEDALGNLIQNALDVLRDLLTIHFPLNYNNNFFNTGEWEVAKLQAPNVHYFAHQPVEIISIVEEISASVLGIFLVEDGGRYTYRIYNALAPALQTIRRDEVLELPVVHYDPTEILTKVWVGYGRDWASGEPRWYLDDSQEDELFLRWKVHRDERFPTLLTSSADAAAHAAALLSFYGDKQRTVPVKTKLQTAQRKIGDPVEVEVYRRTKKLLGKVKAEIIGISKDLITQEISLTCRIVELLPETIYVQGTYYGDSFYGDGFYSETGNQEVA